ncbi:hypothetical protein [Nocardia brevicatena]|uniref:hypothetical protein n=1 Tax=Nocardia brevicatena TaxID=37327 RepID=UPI000306CAC0|nr:hypothetical protein [Nocardia brevicatena]
MTLTSELFATDDTGPLPAIVDVDGIPVSGLPVAGSRPAGGAGGTARWATDSVYFDCPGHPEYSLLRVGQRLGHTVAALDRPGFDSVGHTALAYHLGVVAFAEECVIAHTIGEFTYPTRQFDGEAVPPSGR